MSLFEWMAALSLLINVYLASRTNILNFLFGAIGVSIYSVIFLQSKLYADMSLQLIYLFLQFYGAYQWKYGSRNHNELAINKANKKIWAGVILSTLILFGFLCFILSRYTDSTTIKMDAFTTALSLTAQWMMNRKILENWLAWIVVDSVSIQMYLTKHLYVTAGLYIIFFIICCMGYFTWRNNLIRNNEIKLLRSVQ